MAEGSLAGDGFDFDVLQHFPPRYACKACTTLPMRTMAKYLLVLPVLPVCVLFVAEY